MKPIKLIYIDDNTPIQSEVKTISQLCDLCAKVGGKFEPTLENQLNSMYVEDYTDRNSADGVSIIISMEDRTTGKMNSGVVKTINDLIYTVHNIFKSSRYGFYPPLAKQLADGGGWNEDKIKEYRSFIEEVQEALPTDYRVVEVESKIDEFLNFWQNEASPADATIGTFMDQLVELKKIVFH